MKYRSNGLFWVSYSDLMTSLFFVMLVLFAVSFYEQQATQKQLDKIKEIENAVNALPANYFEYQEKFKRHTLKKAIEFPVKSSLIDSSNYAYLLDVGKSIEDLISKLKHKFSGQDIRYLIVIEGMASNIAYSRNYELSYERALALYKFWQSNQIQFDPTICEIQIAGSGTGGVGRFSGTDENKNQRFLIQIIPKIGKIEQ